MIMKTKLLFLSAILMIASTSTAQYVVDDTDATPFFDISTSGTDISADLSDDGETNLTLDFMFTLDGGTTSDQIRVGNNGGIIFDATAGDIFAGNTALAAAPDERIVVFWDDLDTETGAVYHETIGTAPARQFILQFNDRTRFSGADDLGMVTMQIVLNEADGGILFAYRDVIFENDDGSNDNGASATIGVKSNLGTYEYSFDTAMVQDGQSIRYSQPLGIEDNIIPGFRLSPNPANDIINLRANNAITNVTVYSILGQEVINKNFDTTDAMLDISALTSGSYILKVTAGNVAASKKLIKL
jgi:hypothetical protein